MDRKAWIVITACVLVMGVQAWWNIKHPPPPAPEPVPTATATPSPAAATTTPNASPAAPGNPAAPAVTSAPEQKVVLKNDTVAYTFSTKGGGILTAELLDTPDHVQLNALGKGAMGTLNSAPKVWDDVDYHIVSQTASGITFEGETANHLLIRKEYHFSEGRGADPHLLTFKLTFVNKSGARLSRSELFLYAGAASSLRPDETLRPSFAWNEAGDMVSKDTGSFAGGWFSTAVPELTQSVEKLRWAGPMSRFYAQLIVTKDDTVAKLWAEPFAVNHSNDEFKDLAAAKKDQAIQGGIILPPLDLDNAEPKSFDLRIYLGPKIYKTLSTIDSGEPDRQLRLAMNYGYAKPVSIVLVTLLRWIHDVVSNWGIAIILLTLLVRGSCWPVTAKANSSMKRMQLVSPKMKELQEKYKEDPQRMNQEVFKLYREYGVNPMGGCLPMLVQIPIFYGLYRALWYAAELRGQGFLWVHDLAMPDTVGHLLGYAVNPLPLLMGVSSLLQMRLTPQPTNADKTQANIIKFMPVVITLICYNFASALALYWTTSNIFSIFQAQIQRRFGKTPELKKKVTVERPRPAAFGAPAAKEKKKSSLPRLGGGGSRSTRGKDS